MFRIEIRKEMETKNRNRIESLLENCKHSAHDKSRFNSLRDSKISPNAISPTTTKGGEEKGNNTHPLFRKTDNTNRIPWKRGYSPTDKKSISLPFLGTGRAHSQRSLQFVIPIFLTLCRTLAEGNALMEVEGIRGNV